MSKLIKIVIFVSFSFGAMLSAASELRKETEYHKNGNIFLIHSFDGEKLVRLETWNIDGSKKIDSDFEYPSKDTVIQIDHLPVAPGNPIYSKRLFRLPENLEDKPVYAQEMVLLKWWRYDNAFNLILADEFVAGTKQVKKREVFQDEKVHRILKFEFKQETGEQIQKFQKYGYALATRVDVYDAQMNKLNEYEPMSYEALAEFIEKQRPLSASKNPVGILDSGFHLLHTDLKNKVWVNPGEQYDGEDNDDNQVVDDLIGLGNGETDAPFIEEEIYLSGEKLSSDGTHTASVALKGIKDFGFVGFNGNPTSEAYLKAIELFVVSKKVRFFNIGFTIPLSFDTDTNDAIQIGYWSLIANTVGTTLFFSAAGDGGFDYDIAQANTPHYLAIPTSFMVPHKITVGAVDTNEIRKENLKDYRRLESSNYGLMSVDIFAPGKELVGADIVEKHSVRTGTAPATAFVTNVALRIAEINPSLTNAQIKEIILKTAFVPSLDQPLPVRSAGIVFPERAYGVAAALMQTKGMSVEEAVFSARRAEAVPGEENTEEFLNRLKQFWKDQGV